MTQSFKYDIILSNLNFSKIFKETAMLNKIKDFFFFKTMVTPIIVQVIYIALVLLMIVTGIVVMIDGAIFRGLWIIIFGPFSSRILCELIILLFSINETLSKINNKLTPKNP